ncbi:hypothetical protein [Vibrio coralliilyticus]|uniref:hypothetical protein n=1 Tax=Vibrio coralliilyticus TaxID=190893 RepID=UPI00148E8137|nr:hypothetical protein [Vibrio coralliilyticus]NOI27144.1 hypothetical protein [Vibrio coralliilyticus]NOI46565.1 hypothetical protein [Vibrio coralliilyticus]
MKKTIIALSLLVLSGSLVHAQEVDALPDEVNTSELVIEHNDESECSWYDGEHKIVDLKVIPVEFNGGTQAGSVLWNENERTVLAAYSLDVRETRCGKPKVFFSYGDFENEGQACELEDSGKIFDFMINGMKVPMIYRCIVNKNGRTMMSATSARSDGEAYIDNELRAKDKLNVIMPNGLASIIPTNGYAGAVKQILKD